MNFLLCLCAIIGVTSAATIEYSSSSASFAFPKQKTLKEPIIRIVGGQEASPHQFPYQVGLYIYYQLSEAFCGGSLVSVNYVLTAAHCAEGAISIDIILGAHNISDNSETSRQRFTSSKYLVHPNWDSSALVNDLALIQLPSSAILNEYVQLVKVASGTDTYAGNAGVITGWGKTTDAQTSVTDILRYTSNAILSNTECRAVDSDYNGIIKDTHLCLSGNGNISACKGDSGGPLVAGDTQVGITSFSYKSCEASKPSVFTRVADYAQWIRDNSDVTL